MISNRFIRSVPNKISEFEGLILILSNIKIHFMILMFMKKIFIIGINFHSLIRPRRNVCVIMIIDTLAI